MVLLFEISLTWFWALMCCSGLLGLILGAYMVKKLDDGQMYYVDAESDAYRTKDHISKMTVEPEEDEHDYSYPRRRGIPPGDYLIIRSTEDWGEYERRLWLNSFHGFDEYI